MGQRHVCTFRHAQRAAYRTAILAAQILVIIIIINCIMRASWLDAEAGTERSGVAPLRGAHIRHGTVGADSRPLRHRPRLGRPSRSAVARVARRRCEPRPGRSRVADGRNPPLVAPVPLRLRAGRCLDRADHVDVVRSGPGAGHYSPNSATKYGLKRCLIHHQHCMQCTIVHAVSYGTLLVIVVNF